MSCLAHRDGPRGATLWSLHCGILGKRRRSVWKVSCPLTQSLKGDLWRLISALGDAVHLCHTHKPAAQGPDCEEKAQEDVHSPQWHISEEDAEVEVLIQTNSTHFFC